MKPELTTNAYGFIEIAAKPSEEELGKYYAEKYYQEGRGSYEVAYGEEEITYFNNKIRQRAFVVDKILASSATSTRTLIDIGCGEGFALNFFANNGYVVKGLDFSSAGVRSNHPHLLQNLVTGDLIASIDNEISAENKYDLVWLQNVLEHVLDPVKLLISLQQLLAPGGVAVITVPNDFSITQQALIDQSFVSRQYWLCPPDHLSYFNSKTLLKLLRETQWNCLEMLADIPVDWFLFNPASNYIENPSVGKSAHHARIAIENYISQQPLDDTIAFFSAAARLGVGRDLTVFVQPS